MLLEEVKILKLEYLVVLFDDSFLLDVNEICQEYQVLRIFRVVSVFFISLFSGYLQNLFDVGYSFFPHLPLNSIFEYVSGVDKGVIALADVDFHAFLYFKQSSAGIDAVSNVLEVPPQHGSSVQILVFLGLGVANILDSLLDKLHVLPILVVEAVAGYLQHVKIFVDGLALEIDLMAVEELIDCIAVSSKLVGAKEG